jgi:hypothetical protein
MPTQVRWQGTDDVRAGFDLFLKKCQTAAMRIAQYFQPLFEAYAQDNARWIDRTGNARQALYSFVQVMSVDVVRLYIAHGVEYGLWLEVRFAGKYAILWETVSAHIEEIKKLLKKVFGR